MMSTHHTSGSYRRTRELAEAHHDLLEQKMKRAEKKISGNVSDALKLARERIQSVLDAP